ncbi:Gfo/Idh/MocA family protein [Paenibacillus cellulositrophicus]|uniref:Gfo/Idh/MocA family protein n=1 Tax=Paenibacillus cellulositrophicus TaxID=562959 RepID=UPI003F7F7084
MNMVNIGFLGLGRVLEYHLPAIERVSDRFRIASVFDMSERRRAEIAEQLGAKAAGSYEEMLNDPDLHLLVVATPPRFHAEHAIQALESGKHVIVEKPMALSAADAARMVEAAERKGRKLVVNHNHRFSGHQQYPFIKRTLDEGTLGRPYQYHIQLMSPWGGYEGSPDYIPNWECKKEHGGGTLFSWGPHLVDMLLQAHPAKPVSVYARLNSGGWEFDGDSNAALAITFEDGASAQIDISYVSPHPFNLFYVQCEGGSIKYEQDTNRVTVRRGAIRKGFEEEIVAPEQLPPDLVYENLYGAIHQGEGLLIEPRDIELVIAILEGAVLSSETGKAVAVADVLQASRTGIA